jgi:cytochrome P450
VGPSEYGAAVEKQLCFEIKTFLLAGHETSAAMLTWTMYELSRNGAAMGRVVCEAEHVFGKLDQGALPTRDSLASLEYSLAVAPQSGNHRNFKPHALNPTP